LNLFETTMPDNVRIAAVRPGLDPKRGIVLAISVVAKSADDVNQLMDNLESTGAFVDPISTSDRVGQDGQLEAVLDTVYVPKAGRAIAGGPRRR
jgi:Tfp pilus assembly protein PilN